MTATKKAFAGRSQSSIALKLALMAEAKSFLYLIRRYSSEAVKTLPFLDSSFLSLSHHQEMESKRLWISPSSCPSLSMSGWDRAKDLFFRLSALTNSAQLLIALSMRFPDSLDCWKSIRIYTKLVTKKCTNSVTKVPRLGNRFTSNTNLKVEKRTSPVSGENDKWTVTLHFQLFCQWRQQPYGSSRTDSHWNVPRRLCHLYWKINSTSSDEMFANIEFTAVASATDG